MSDNGQMLPLEEVIVKKLGDAWNLYLELIEQHPCDRQEFMHAIHRAQHLVMIRPTRRVHDFLPADKSTSSQST